MALVQFFENPHNAQRFDELHSSMTRFTHSDLSAFVAVATLRSFRRAAVEIGVSPSAVSHTIRGLEERLGVQLLNRTSRSVAPTEAGARLLARLRPAFLDIVAAVEDVNKFRDTPMGTLRLNVPRAAASLVLAPLMARFLKANPQMRLEIVTDDGFVDIVAAGFDAGIRFGERVERDMTALRIGPDLRLAVVGSPAYFAAHGKPRTPEDLQRHACIRFRFPGGAVYRWKFEKEGQPVEVEIDGPLTVSAHDLMIRAAIDGAGLACTYEGFVEPSLGAGRLERVLEDWCPRFEGLSLYYPSRRLVPAGLRAFIDLARKDRRGAGGVNRDT